MSTAELRPVGQLSLAVHGVSIVVPAYNEEENVGRVHERLSTVMNGLGLPWELIFAVDPCTDRTEQRITELHAADSRVKMLRFSRRFGQPMATIAGMEAASGAAVMRKELTPPAVTANGALLTLTPAEVAVRT